MCIERDQEIFEMEPETENIDEEYYDEDYDYDYDNDNLEIGFNPYSGEYDFDC